MYEKCFQWAKDTMKHKEKNFYPTRKAVKKSVIKEIFLSTTLRCQCLSPMAWLLEVCCGRGGDQEGGYVVAGSGAVGDMMLFVPSN